MFSSLGQSGLCSKEIGVMRDVTVGRMTSSIADKSLVCSNQRNTLDAFFENWLENHVGEIPVVYFHNGNTTMATLFRQLLPQSLMIGAYAPNEYDPLRDIPIQMFFNELAAENQATSGRISVPYIKGIGTLLLLDRFEPTLYRLNAYANGNLGAIIERLSDNMNDSTYAMLNRCMNKSDTLIENTLDYLDMLCDACGAGLNKGNMLHGKSIVSALRDGLGVSIDTSELSNAIAADMIFAQLSLARKQGIDYVVVLDTDMISDRLGNYLVELGTSRVCLMLCPDIWSVSGSSRPFTQNILASRSQTIFFPNSNMQMCKNLSGFLDTYWRENRTYMEGSHKGRNRKALTILPMYANGQTKNVTVAYTRESVMSANELRSLPRHTAIMMIDGIQPILACEMGGC